LEEQVEQLMEAALRARENAHAPYSDFRVGAAAMADDGVIYTGCNIENASYGLTICAERVAVYKALSEGNRNIQRLAVVADTHELTPPCGACRQVLWELCPSAEIIMANLAGKSEVIAIADILPRAFDSSFLGPKK
jgi:cytidine deaminase